MTGDVDASWIRAGKIQSGERRGKKRTGSAVVIRTVNSSEVKGRGKKS